jgi:hypothetical protein
MCACELNRICGYHYAVIEKLHRQLRDAERNNTGMQEPLRRALAEHGRKADLVILAIETKEAA